MYYTNDTTEFQRPYVNYKTNYMKDNSHTNERIIVLTKKLLSNYEFCELIKGQRLYITNRCDDHCYFKTLINHGKEIFINKVKRYESDKIEISSMDNYFSHYNNISTDKIPRFYIKVPITHEIYRKAESISGWNNEVNPNRSKCKEREKEVRSSDSDARIRVRRPQARIGRIIQPERIRLSRHSRSKRRN